LKWMRSWIFRGRGFKDLTRAEIWFEISVPLANSAILHTLTIHFQWKDYTRFQWEDGEGED